MQFVEILHIWLTMSSIALLAKMLAILLAIWLSILLIEILNILLIISLVPLLANMLAIPLAISLVILFVKILLLRSGRSLSVSSFAGWLAGRLAGWLVANRPFDN